MIHYHADSRTFALLGKASVYQIRISEKGEVEHLGYCSLPQANDLPRNWDRHIPTRTIRPTSSHQSFQCEYPAFGDTSLNDVALKVSFPKAARIDPATEAPHEPVRDARLRYAGHEIGSVGDPGFAPKHGLPVRSKSPRTGLKIRLKDELYPFYVTLFYRLTPEHDIIERWVELENACEHPVEVEKLAFASLSLDAFHWEITHVSGGWCREFQIERHTLHTGRFVWGSQAIITGLSTNPFFLLNQSGGATESVGEVLFGALAYSGNWEISAEVQERGGLRLSGGYHSLDFRMSLAPGEKHRTPAMVWGRSSGGWSGASQQLHAWAQDYVLPRPATHAPYLPVLYNSWEVAYFNIKEEEQMALARKAAEVGVEMFCIDDGWFGGRRDSKAGLGDWVVSKDILPRGLQPLIAEVHQLGMSFGLWVEPEMVNQDSDLYRAHPDWVLHFPGRARSEYRNQKLLDFGRPEVVAHILEQLDRLLQENKIDFFKWDMNRYATEPGSAAGRDIWYRHVAGVYGIMDELRRRHPHLSIESCSSGGGRVDFGMMGRVEQFWASDNTDAKHRILIQEGYSMAYPVRTMECWVTHERNHQTLSFLPLSLRFDCAMRGALGIGTPLNKITPEELEEYRRRIAFYKKIRPVIQDGILHRLERAEDRGTSVWQYMEAGGQRAVLSLLAHHAAMLKTPPRLRLHGLIADACYRLTDFTGQELGRASGWSLMTLGYSSLSNNGAENYSETILLEVCPE